jgi:hypothetical protein
LRRYAKTDIDRHTEAAGNFACSRFLIIDWYSVSEIRIICVVMYGRPPLGKGFFGGSASGSGAVMYPAFVRGAWTAGPEGVRGRVPIIPARCDAR